MTDDPRTAHPWYEREITELRERAEAAERRIDEWIDTCNDLRVANQRLRDALRHTLSNCTVYRCVECDAARAVLAATEEPE